MWNSWKIANFAPICIFPLAAGFFFYTGHFRLPVVLMVFFFVLLWWFMKNYGDAEKEEQLLTKEACLQIAMEKLEKRFKFTVERQGSFTMADDAIVGDFWRFVFSRKIDGIQNYFLASINRKDGTIGERTGVRTNQYREVQWFLNKDSNSYQPQEWVTSEMLGQMRDEVVNPDSDKKKEGDENAGQ